MPFYEMHGPFLCDTLSRLYSARLCSFSSRSLQRALFSSLGSFEILSFAG